VLDTACARLALGQNTTPAGIEAAQRTLDDLAVQERVLSREASAGANHDERLASIATHRTSAEQRLTELKGRWDYERDLVLRIRELREKLEQNAEGVNKSELATLNSELAQAQGEDPLVRVCVDAGSVGEVISGWTGIPVGKMMRDDLAVALGLEKHLGARIIGQNEALAAICRRIRTSRAGIEDPNKPKGVFLLVGPSGVGKTETALALSTCMVVSADHHQHVGIPVGAHGFDLQGFAAGACRLRKVAFSQSGAAPRIGGSPRRNQNPRPPTVFRYSTRV
jgi:type VI secretion system protein VasG